MIFNANTGGQQYHIQSNLDDFLAWKGLIR